MISDSEDLQISVIDTTQLKAIWQISDRRSLFGAPNALKFAKNYEGVQEIEI